MNIIFPPPCNAYVRTYSEAFLSQEHQYQKLTKELEEERKNVALQLQKVRKICMRIQNLKLTQDYM